MASTTRRSGVPFLMAKDVVKKVSREIRSESRGKGKKKMVTAGRVRKMIAGELRARNEKAIASSYDGGAPENMGSREDRYKPPVGSADTDQHGAYRADRDSVLHDRSKRFASAS